MEELLYGQEPTAEELLAMGMEVEHMLMEELDITPEDILGVGEVWANDIY